jgi:hypothetical protein
MAAVDLFAEPFARATSHPATHAAAVTPHDSNELSYVTRAIFVGGAGALKVTTSDGDTVTFTGVTAGTVLPIRAKVVFSTGTTATNIVAMW